MGDLVKLGAPEPRCNLCKLGEQSQELLDIIHQMRWRDNKPYRAIVDEVNTLIARDGLEEQGVKPLFLSGLVKHMTDHIPPEKILVHELQEASSAKRKLLPNDPDAVHRAVQIKRASLEKIEANAKVWQKVFETCRKEFDELPAETNPMVRKMAVEAMAKAHTTWAELVKAKETLLKERYLTVEIAQQAVDVYARSLAGAMAEQLVAVRDDTLASDPEAGEAVEKMYAGFRDAVLSAVSGLYEESLKTVMERYNI